MLLGWIAGEMAAKEEVLARLIHEIPAAHYALPVFGALLVLAFGRILQRRASAVGTNDV